MLTGAALLLVFMAGCQLGPKYQAPPPPAVTAANYKESVGNPQDASAWKPANPADAMLRGNWWEVYHEPELNALEDQLNIDNQNIKIFFENYMAAEAVVAQARTQFWPTITTTDTWNRSLTSANQHVSSTTNTGTTSSLWTLPVNVSWTPDFWGKIRNQVLGATASAQLSAANLEVEKLLEQSQLAQYYFEIRGEDSLQKILNDTVTTDQQSLDYAQAQYDSGIGTYLAVAQARTTLETARAQATSVGLLRNQYEHAMAMLLGKVATDFSIPVRPMTYTPPPIPTGIPSQLLERRPDVAAAERKLASDNATIGIGYGAFFPNITLSASGSLQSALGSKLFSLPSRTWAIGPSVAETIFNAGLYRAELHQYTAVYNSDLASYRESVLTAFQQVEDYLSNTRVYSSEIQHQQEAVKAAQEYLNIANDRYITGVDTYLNVMLAQNSLLSAQSALNAQQISEMVASVQLVQALGGGWNSSELPTPAQIKAKPAPGTYARQQ
jgi:NodT family efflux transporter outer membrane factor (OMF) lipoprotein